jgi:hypothetical protein
MFRFVYILIPGFAFSQNHSEIFIMSRSHNAFLVKQTLTAVILNGIFSAIAVFVTFRHMAVVQVSGSPSLIADSILQTFIATLMSILPPSVLTAKWMLTRPDLTSAKTSGARILARAVVIALAACLASSVVLPFAMPRLLAPSLTFRNMLLLKCLYGMVIGMAVTPFAVAAVLREPRRSERSPGALDGRLGN